MITTSDKYKTAVSKSVRHFRLKIDIAGTEYTGIKSFKLKGGTNSSEQITFGDAVSSYIEFILTDVPKNTILKGRQAIPYIGLELDDGTIEWIKKGVYNLEKPVRSGEFIKLTAYDNFALCYKGFFTGLSGNQKIDAILQEQCQKIGIEYAGGADDVTYKVDNLQGLTIIEAVSVLAAYCGKNAIMDKDGKLRLVWYTDTGLTISPSRFADPLEIDEEDTFINRLDCTIDEEHSVSAGTGVGIYFSCPGMTQERITVLYNRIKGFTYRTAKLNWRMAQPDVEAGDLVRVMDNAGNAYVIPLMDYEFNCDGGFYGIIQSKGKTEQEQDTGYKGPLQTKVDRTYSDLVSTKQVITDKITAFEGEFETINTNYLEVNKKLTALDAEIENLDVTELTAKVAIIETSYVSKEYVQDLYATKAEVHVLDVDLERVNTLLAGSVTAGSTQTIVLNADNTTISNALIKSAMIDSVAADKVTAGTIDASSIHFKSQSGRLDIFGETLQVKDATRTRVQIGKDGTGDYALSQWDAQGNLMWDSRGAKAAAIKDKIIVNDMVSDNAGIEGKKINITSLVKEINDGTEVIKSSHILVDGANQSLSVVYNTITGDISTLSTALSVEQGKVSSLITDVSQAKGDVSTLQTNYSSLTQTVNGINSTVSSHTSSIDALNNMEIGGVNLLVIKTAIKGKYLNKSGEEVIEGGWFYSDYISVSELKNLTTSGYSNLGISPSVCYYDSSKNFIKGINNNGQSKAQHIAIESGIAYIRFSGMIKDIPTLKIEKGTKATNYSPAPEDVDASIKTVSDKTSTLEQTINGFDARITSATSTAGNALTKANEVSATVDGLTVRVSTAETNASTALSKTNTLEQKVTASALITTISSGISGGTALSTTKFVMDASGLHIKNGGFDISNNAGSKVFTADTAGNLSITASINAASGKIGKFTLNDGLTYTGSSTYQGMGGSVTESYSFIISPNSNHKNLGDIARDFVSGWNNPLLKVSTSANNSFELYPDGFLKTDSIKMYEGVVTGTLYFGSSQYSNSIAIHSNGNIVTTGYVLASGNIESNGGCLRSVNFGFATQIGSQNSGYCHYITDAPNHYFNKPVRVEGDIYGGSSYNRRLKYADEAPITHIHSYTTWLASQYSTNGWFGFYSTIGGGSRKAWMGHDGGSDFWIQNETGGAFKVLSSGHVLEYNGKYYDGNWSSGWFRPLQSGTALGSSGDQYRWYRLYSVKAESASSDIRLKTNIKAYDARFENMYMDLKPITYELKAYPEQSECGLIAQWVKESMDKFGISEREFGVYEHDLDTDSYSLSYASLTSLNMHMVQKTIKRVDAIDDELLSIKVSRQQDAQELQQELQKRDFEISQLQHRIQQLESRS